MPGIFSLIASKFDLSKGCHAIPSKSQGYSELF
jgi:hypothetical protein